jgi:YidC/Oxa1 family membrane protein insertase
MDNQRLLIWAAFGLTAWMTYQAWMSDYGPQSTAVIPTTEVAISGTDLPEAPGESLPELSTNGADAPAALPTSDGQAAQVATTTAPSISVTTDVFEIEISTQGGTIRRASLLRYPVHKDRPDELVELLSPASANFGMIRTGLRSDDESRPGPDHLATFSAPRSNYSMSGTDDLVVPLHWTGADGSVVEKRYIFSAGSYIIRIEQAVQNAGETEWRLDQYAQLMRHSSEPKRSMFNVDSYSFAGPIVYNGEKSEKLKRDDLLEDGAYQNTTKNGWLGAIEHHFLSAVVPTPDAAHIFQVSVTGDISTASVIGAKQSIAAGETQTFVETLFVGPKLQAQLETIDPSLKLTVDYGWLTIISQPLFWLLSKVFGFVGNWGVTIILVTMIIKAAFYKLTESSGRSMAKMRNLQPRLKALQERYKDDKQQLSTQMMELYKREKVNPAAGCLPILIQMPFFLAFYWVLLESVEMRQAPFALWITDLSSRDPYFILPLIMGAAMFLQQKLNPQVGDPMQVKVMQIMPIIFTGFFAFFPAGLVLYWVTNTVLSIAQQWKINTVVEREAKEKKLHEKKPKRDKKKDSAKKEIEKTDSEKKE